MIELGQAGSEALGVPVSERMVDRLAAYSRAVASYPCAIKEVRYCMHCSPINPVVFVAVSLEKWMVLQSLAESRFRRKKRSVSYAHRSTGEDRISLVDAST